MSQHDNAERSVSASLFDLHLDGTRNAVDCPVKGRCEREFAWQTWGNAQAPLICGFRADVSQNTMGQWESEAETQWEAANTSVSRARFQHSRHAKRTLSNTNMHGSLHMPRRSTVQLLLQSRHASGVPCLPREVHAHHALGTRILHDSPRLPRGTTMRHAPNGTAPRDTRGRSRTHAR